MSTITSPEQDIKPTVNMLENQEVMKRLSHIVISLLKL